MHDAGNNIAAAARGVTVRGMHKKQCRIAFDNLSWRC
jgi:hypothetical protein